MASRVLPRLSHSQGNQLGQLGSESARSCPEEPDTGERKHRSQRLTLLLLASQPAVYELSSFGSVEQLLPCKLPDTALPLVS